MFSQTGDTEDRMWRLGGMELTWLQEEEEDNDKEQVVLKT